MYACVRFVGMVGQGGVDEGRIIGGGSIIEGIIDY